MHTAFLLTDSRYWHQAQEEIDANWTLVKVGGHGEPQDWIEWIVVRRSSVSVYVFFFPDIYPQSQAGSSRIGIDARMISHEKATLLNSKLSSMESKLVYPPQNLVDLIWKAKPIKPDAAIYIQSTEFAGVFHFMVFFHFSIFSTRGFRQGG
jgi:Xaa-Pro aminopeptidase